MFKMTQAFANPTDLASSGVWKNVFLGKRPGFDGVRRKIFFIILVTVKSDGCLSTTIYRKPTHTNQYLQWGSHLLLPVNTV